LSKVGKCNIEECQYNANQACFADNIEVRSSTNDMTVGMSENTCCETFKPKIQG